ncbi:MAG: MoaD/ThiS family protein [Chloroflexota bacterium]
MQVTLGAFGDLRRYTPQQKEKLPVALAEQATVMQLLEAVGVPWNEVGLVVVNGSLTDENHVLADGDKVEVFSPIGGGS